ncbi:MAG: class I adenylate-forming enzyme family protein [Pseudomonadota bacterium]
MTGRVEEFLHAQAATRPQARALSDTVGTAWRYGDLAKAATSVRLMLQEAGVCPQDRVLLICENCAAAVAVLFACWEMDAVAIPLNARQSPAEVTRVLEHAKPAVVLGTTDVSPDAAAHLERMGGAARAGAFGRLHLASPFPSVPDDALRGAAVLLYTTGTTGDPKGVILTHDNLRFGGKASAQLRGMTAADVIYGVLPISHVFGLASVVTAAAYAGARIDLVPRFAPAALYAALVGDGITLLSAVPQMHALLMEYVRAQGLTRLEGHALRYVSSGAAPLDPSWKRKAEAFYGVALQNGYGMTEATAGVCITQNEIGADDISTGPPLPGIEVRIDESAVGGGAGAGEVLVRGPNVMRGYYRNVEATHHVLDAEGWLRTGDLGRFDTGGSLHILGRSKELIIHGGFNVYPPEVEAALNDHPAVIQSAVIGEMVAGDEKVLAFVQLANLGDVSADELMDFVGARLAGYKRPGRIILATDLPAAPTGKILKHKLPELLRRADAVQR